MAAQTADQRIIFNTTTGALLYDSDGMGGVAARQFATLWPAGLNGVVGASDFNVVA
jgi:Ca2+-binding RTX toxin-like protein